MPRAIRDSGYAGPTGILVHCGTIDAEEALRANCGRLKTVLEELGDDHARATYR
ncbi:MAG: hypothetical protein U1E05_06220 [Patescibacteria group bacterium]|nr:hypothetical protein [Patescibacteria group bacterium]